MNKNIFLSIVMVFILFTMCKCQSNCEIQGEWTIKYGNIAKNYEMSSPYTENRTLFSNDTIELLSGFFYNTLGLDDEYPRGRYPYIYYGNKERYKIEEDSLYIYSGPYKTWSSFKINCVRQDTLLLFGRTDSILLARQIVRQEDYECQIKYIKARIFDGDLSLFKNNYKVSYSNDDQLIFQELDSLGRNNIPMSFNLKKGTFKRICNGFRFIEISRLKKMYSTEISEINTIWIEIGMENGKVIKLAIQNMSCPDELRLALIPVLYTHQQYIPPVLPEAR